MKKYPTLPRQIVEDWPSSVETEKPGNPVHLHYHEVEEWLEVLQGQITFSPVSGKPKQVLREGEALFIPKGELHSVKVGLKGVNYRMWTPVPVSGETFRKKLDPDELTLVRNNLAVPDAENKKDKHPDEVRFLDRFLSNDLIFRTAGGEIVTGKKEFLIRGPGPAIRYSSGSVRVLQKTVNSLVIATVVFTKPLAGGPQSFFENLRLFRKEMNLWKCFVWINYPE